MRAGLGIATVCVAAAGLLGSAAWAQDATRTRTGNRVTVVTGGGSYLGVGVQEIDAERAKALKLKEERGVEVRHVVSDSPAAQAGIKEGDVVLDYNGQAVEGTEQFVRLVHETPPGRRVKIEVWRNGAPETITATVDVRKAPSGRLGGEWLGWLGEMPHVEAMPAMPPMPPMPDMPEIHTGMRNLMLGIEGESLTPQLAEFFGAKEGVLVRAVTKNSAAEKAGLKAGDVIVKVDETAVTNTHEISSALRAARSKKTFQMTVIRNKKEMTIPVTIEERTGEGIRAATHERTC